MQKTVVVGMSGGVDSSVSALLLKDLGYRVIGLFMKNWEEKDDRGVCRSAEDYDDVDRVCKQLDIPCYGVNFSEEYRTHVFAGFIDDLNNGLTPNPDILCNREIKFKVFLAKAMELGADYLATGHYAQKTLKDGRFYLKKGNDPKKDQTYFLYTLTDSILQKVLFPVGEMEKSEVRRIAGERGLATAEKKDSTGICFIGDRHFRTFISRFVPFRPGRFETLSGKIVGTHNGAAYYTIGQRKGLGIGGPGEAWFVVGKDIDRGIVFVEQGAEHPALYSDRLYASELTWVVNPPGEFPFPCSAKTRYRQTDHPCTIETIVDGEATVTFPNPERAVTPGQSIVFYDGSICLGGGIIRRRGPSYHEQNKPLPLSMLKSVDPLEE